MKSKLLIGLTERSSLFAIEDGFSLLDNILEVNIVPVDGDLEAEAFELKPQFADTFDHWLEASADCGNFGSHHIGLLSAHPLGRGPRQAQQEGRDPGFCDQLLQDLANRDLAIEHLVIGADDFDLDVAGGDEIADGALAAGLHSLAPLASDGEAAILCIASAVFADDGEAHITHTVPVIPGRLEDFQKDAGQEGHRAQEGDAIGGADLRLVGGKEEQILSRQRLNGAVRIS